MSLRERGPQPVQMIVGNMYAGKTEELTRRVQRAKYQKLQVQVFKPIIDDRYSAEEIGSHNGQKYPAIPVPHTDPDAIWQLVDNDTNLVAIDEIQFFDPQIIEVVEALQERGIRVIGAGLPSDFRNEPFGSVGHLLCTADDITRLTAICTGTREDGRICGETATRTQRFIDGKPAKWDDPVIVVGGKEMYEARCVIHHKIEHEKVHRLR